MPTNTAIETYLRDAHAGLQIVDFLIEKDAPRLAYRATNPVFEAIRQALEIVEAADDAEKGEAT